MRIGILGSGLMGGKLGTLFARAGHDVVFSYSHDDAKLRRLARAAGGKAHAGTPAEAARGADALLLAVHWSQVDRALKQAGDLSGKVIVSCTLPMNADDTKLVVANTSSGAEVLAKKARRSKIVAAFSTVPSEALMSVFRQRHRRNRPNVIYCGDDSHAKTVAATLIRAIGFHPVDAGPLRIARYLEPASLLIAQFAYEMGSNPRVVYRVSRIGD